MPKTLFSAPIKAPAKPLVVYFATRKGKDKSKDRARSAFEEVSERVVKLAIEFMGNGSDTVHGLRRLDGEGQTVWLTRHPSLQETFWRAEWEYAVKQDEWRQEV